MPPTNNKDILLHNHINNINPNKKINNNNNNNNKNVVTSQQNRTHGSTAQACAACKYQRRKCAADCILAPYFPQDRHHQFLNAHRLFGVSNIVKIVRHLDPTAKDHAMRTIIFQSDARAADPVGGCHRIIRDLELQISLAKAELDIVLHHLEICRAGAGNVNKEVVDLEVNSSWSTCMHGAGNVNNNNNEHAESTTSSSFVHHHHHEYNHDLNNNNDDMMRSLSMDDCNQMKSILDQLSVDGDVLDTHHEQERYGNILTSNAILREGSGTFKEEDAPFSYIQEQNDLKAAATFFTLTNSCDM